MVYRHADGTYVFSTPDGEYRKEYSAEEGLAILKAREYPTPEIREAVLTAVGPRWVNLNVSQGVSFDA